MGLFDTISATLRRTAHPSNTWFRRAVVGMLGIAAFANVLSLFRAIRSTDSFSDVMRNPWPMAALLDAYAGLILAGTYIWAHSQFGIALLVPSLVLSPSIPLGYAALNFKDLLPFNPGTALSPNRPQVLALRGLASAGAAIVGTALLNAWIRQSPSKGWERMAGNKWSGAVFVADVAGMVFAAVYVAAREEWRWRVVIPIWAAVFFVGNGAACVYVVLCTFGTTSLQEALLVGKPVVGARWPFVNTMVGEGGHYAQLDEGLDV